MERDAKKPKSEQPDPAALSFSSHQDALDFARNGIEHANGVAALNPVEFVKAYKERNLAIVLKVTAGCDAGEFDLIFVAVPLHGAEFEATRHDHVLEASPAGKHPDRDQQSVLVGITKLVEGPEGVIPSFVRIERAKQRTDFRREVFAPPLGHSIKISNRVPEGEIGVLGVSLSTEDSGGVSGLVKRRSKRLDSLDGSIAPTIWDWRVNFTLWIVNPSASTSAARVYGSFFKKVWMRFSSRRIFCFARTSLRLGLSKGSLPLAMRVVLSQRQ
jgi:hypothetical protein